MRLETRIPIPGLEVRATRPSTESICMYVWRLGSELKEEGRRRGSCPRCRRPPPPPPPLPSPLGAPERPTDRSYASHPSMSSELLLSSVSLLSLPLPLSSPSSLSLSPAYTSSSVAATPHSDADRRNGRTKANAHTTS